MTSVDEIISQLESQNSALKARLDEAETSVRKLTVERNNAIAGLKVASLAVKHGARPDAVEGIAHHVSINRSWTIDESGDLVQRGADGLPESNGEGGNLGVVDAANRLPEWFYPGWSKPAAPISGPSSSMNSSPVKSTSTPANPPPASSSAAPDTGNPWKVFNLSQQSQIFRENPELALKLATEAGKPVIEGGRVGVMPVTTTR